MLNKNTQVFIGCDSEYQEANTVLFGAPFDSTTSFRPGARFGSAAIRNESFGLETFSPYQNRDLSDIKVCDSGDLELAFGDTGSALKAVESRAAAVLGDGKLPLMLGGEHLVTLGAFRAALKKYPELCLIQFDAHADLREEYLGAGLSHAAVIRRCWELSGDRRIFQFGVRSGDKAEFEWGRGRVSTRLFDFEGLDKALSELAGRPIYLTIDLDVLDPSVLPGTGTPEAGGVTFMQLLSAALSVCRGGNVVACDITELCPVYDQSGASTAAACKLTRELLLALTK